jgi:hypothetical protein
MSERRASSVLGRERRVRGASRNGPLPRRRSDSGAAFLHPSLRTSGNGDARSCRRRQGAATSAKVRGGTLRQPTREPEEGKGRLPLRVGSWVALMRWSPRALSGYSSNREARASPQSPLTSWENEGVRPRRPSPKRSPCLGSSSRPHESGEVGAGPPTEGLSLALTKYC